MSVDFMDRKSEEGFTLVEMIIVVVIITMLLAAVGLRLRGSFGRAKEEIAKVTISQIDGSLDLYMIDAGSYPSEGMGLEVLVQNPGDSLKWKGPYIKKIPEDPWGHPYIYTFPGTHGLEYDLCSAGKDETAGTEDDICNWQ